ILEIRTVSEGGILAIKGVKSQYYISMSRSGILQGKKEYSDSCNFREVLLENFYTAYVSEKWSKSVKEMFISLSQKGRPLKGKKTRKESVASHFIPRRSKFCDLKADTNETKDESGMLRVSMLRVSMLRVSMLRVSMLRVSMLRVSMCIMLRLCGGGEVLEGGGEVLEGGGEVLKGGGQVLEGGGEVLEGGGEVLKGGGQVLEGGCEVLEGGGQVLEGGGVLWLEGEGEL
ncbi:fibroblast growth factor 7, partial [Clarias magur]